MEIIKDIPKFSSNPSDYINTSGGWDYNGKGIFKTKTKVNIKCEQCGYKFTTTKNRNHLVQDRYIWICSHWDDPEYDTYPSKQMVELAKRHLGICPNCSHQNHIFCEEYNPREIYIQEISYKGFLLKRFYRITTQRKRTIKKVGDETEE